MNINIIAPVLPEESILDFDSTVETVYGEQQGAEVGVNSHKRGRKSYHPLLVYDAQSRLLVNTALRSGNTNSMTGTMSFAEQTLDLLPPIVFDMSALIKASEVKTSIKCGSLVALALSEK